MSRKLDLRSGRPVWLSRRAPPVPLAKLSGDREAEVLVVGMGISGAMIAEALARDGRQVVMIDRRGPFQGSTAATTALVQYEIDQPLSVLAGKIGRDRAERAWQRSRLAVENLRGRIVELGIACDMVTRPSLYLAGNLLGIRGLQAETEARQQAGIAATYLSAGALRERFGISRKAALLSQGNLTLDPRRLTAGLLRLAAERGAKLFAPMEAAAFEYGRRRVRVGTKEGPVISAEHVVLATGYELASIVPASAHRIISTWAIATRPQPRSLWPDAALVWEAADPYLYARTTADGRVICGGEDEDFADEEMRDAMMDKKAIAIAAKLGKLFPQLDSEPEFAWTGSFGTTSTGLPIIGRLPGHSNVHAVLGYGGNGITFSQIASEVVSSSIGGRTDRDAELFAFPK